MKLRKDIPILIDFDGVIRLGKQPASDALEFLSFLYKENIPSFIISNSTQSTSVDIKNYIREIGVDFKVNAMTTVDATIEYLKERNLRVSAYCIKNIRDKFENFIDDKNPQAVVIGDLADGWSYDVLNEIFRKVHSGAEIIAMQKNKFWQPKGKELFLDAGAFISAIEYATNKKSILIGKPSPMYFQSALKMLGYKNDSIFYMIGDDLETDIYAAQKIGGKGILIYTGKTKFPLSADINIRPDLEAKNLKEVKNILIDVLS